MNPVSPTIPGSDIPETKFAEHQDEYQTLPAILTDDGYVISRWRLTWRERITVLFEGNIFLSCLTFGKPVQPVFLEVDLPRLTQRTR